ncbi:MAG TPA: hypothetical protein VHZ81_13080 [Galbitalea sp.]|nr:hypothetical protein [Galbitalea sp.]
MSDFDKPTEPNDDATSDEDGLVSRLRVIEDQPLESRAAAFAQIHEELQSRLESGDTVGHGA